MGIRAVTGSALGAIIGAALWVYVGYVSGYEISIVSILVGLMAGAGACQGSRGKGGTAAGVMAVIFSVIAIVAARMVIEGMLNHEQPDHAVILEPDGPDLMGLIFILIAVPTAYKIGSGTAFSGQPRSADSANDDESTGN
jgi:hypothetical protein